ncbi:MAG: hemin ABC transporter substrate-binding protein [Myxococcota bacterium]
MRHAWIVPIVMLGCVACESTTEEAKTEAPAAEGKPEASSKAAGKPGDAQQERLVTLGGTVTEIVYALGAGDQVVAVDVSSLHPPAAQKLPKVGYYRKIAAESILSLRPNRVLASEGTGPEAALEQLRSAGVKVELIASDKTAASARSQIETLGEKLGRAEQAKKVVAQLEADLAKAKTARDAITKPPRVLFIYARGMKVLMVGGRDTPADAMITLAGGANAVTAFEGFKPLTPEAVVQANPDVVLLPSHGLESLEGGLWSLPGLAQTQAGKKKAVITIDDLKLLGFGPRMGEALSELSAELSKVEVSP